MLFKFNIENTKEISFSHLLKENSYHAFQNTDVFNIKYGQEALYYIWIESDFSSNLTSETNYIRYCVILISYKPCWI